MDEYFVEEKSSWDKILDFLVFIAVFAVTIFLVLELIAITGSTNINLDNVTGLYLYINIVVFIIFVLDLYRLWNNADGLGDFFKSSWLDVLATIPFGLIAVALGLVGGSFASLELVKWLRVGKLSRVSKLQKLSRVSKLSKEFKAASHLKKESKSYNEKHRL
jgi:hypothetical protein